MKPGDLGCGRSASVINFRFGMPSSEGTHGARARVQTPSRNLHHIDKHRGGRPRTRSCRGRRIPLCRGCSRRNGRSGGSWPRLRGRLATASGDRHRRDDDVERPAAHRPRRVPRCRCDGRVRPPTSASSRPRAAQPSAAPGGARGLLRSHARGRRRHDRFGSARCARRSLAVPPPLRSPKRSPLEPPRG
jgi:hypothetical protein